jgi:peroxiredoxin
VAALGRPAPEFVIPDFTSPQSAGLHRWKGKPVLMVFYSPKSVLVEEVLQLAQEIHNAGRGEVAVLALAMSQDAEIVRKQRTHLHLSVPVLNGTGLRQSYGVEATPKLMVLDDTGILRGSYVGWGRETRTAILADLKPWLSRNTSVPR